MPSNPLALERYDELPPVVRQELEQLVSALQSKLANLAAGGVYNDIPYNAATVSCLPLGTTVTVSRGGFRFLRYTVIGERMSVEFDIRSSATTGNITSFDILLNVPYKVLHQPETQGGNRANPCVVFTGAGLSPGVMSIVTSDQSSSVIVVRVSLLTFLQINTGGQIGVLGEISFKVAPR